MHVYARCFVLLCSKLHNCANFLVLTKVHFMLMHTQYLYNTALYVYKLMYIVYAPTVQVTASTMVMI